MGEKVFILSEQTRKRCKIIELDEKARRRFMPLSLEHFHYLYQATKIDFALYFRLENTMVEFIRPPEVSKELLDQLWSAMQKNSNEIQVCIQAVDRPKFEAVMDDVRKKKIDKLITQIPDLDRKTVDVYSQVSAVSQMIVKGGIDEQVASRVAQSAKYLVSNSIDNDALVGTLSKMINCDPTLYDHSATVAMLAAAISSKNLTTPLRGRDLEIVAQGGLYHDVGKTCVPSAILNKPGRFTPAEFEIMKTHTTEGLSVLEDCIANGAPIDPMITRVAYEHHEKFCGGGYPCNKHGRFEEDPAEGIHLFSRIVTIADVYSALLMKRVYKEAMTPQEALKIMTDGRKDFDPDIFDSFVRSINETVVNTQNKETLKGKILLIGDDGKLSEKPTK